ncbi:MAG: ABC transporter substrate-binding protein [Desulfobaccales bacterium]|jgi:phospholipid transport system substrate-binding protein
MKKRLSIISLAFLAVIWMGILPAAAESPTAFVQGIMDKTMTIQNNPALDTQARTRAIHQIIEQNFDFPMMAKDTLGATYGQLSEGQRQQFNHTFDYLFEDSYTRMVLNFLKQQNIKYGQEHQESGGKTRLDTTLVRANDIIPVTYLMHSAPRGWLLYDVAVDGVSILENYRDEFGRVIRTKSFDYLLQRMEEQRRATE